MRGLSPRYRVWQAARVTPADAYLRLALVTGLGPILIHRLPELVDTPEAIFSIPLDQLQRVQGVGGERARRIRDPRGMEAVATERGTRPCRGNYHHHACRSGLSGCLWCTHRSTDCHLGAWRIRTARPARRCLWLARVKPSAPGHRQARLLSLGLARVGACVVSGLARGIDTVAHEAALTAEGRTIAVLGSGFDHLYPSENQELADRTCAGHGAVISEYPSLPDPVRWHLPTPQSAGRSLSVWQNPGD